MILEREKANDALREELTKYVGWCQMLDQSQVGLSLSFSWWMFDQVCWMASSDFEQCVWNTMMLSVNTKIDLQYSQVPDGLQELLTTTPESWKWKKYLDPKTMSTNSVRMWGEININLVNCKFHFFPRCSVVMICSNYQLAVLIMNHKRTQCKKQHMHS